MLCCCIGRHGVQTGRPHVLRPVQSVVSNIAVPWGPVFPCANSTDGENCPSGAPPSFLCPPARCLAPAPASFGRYGEHRYRPTRTRPPPPPPSATTAPPRRRPNPAETRPLWCTGRTEVEVRAVQVQRYRRSAPWSTKQGTQQIPETHLPISNRPAPQVTSPRTVCHFPSQASPCTGPTHRRDRCKRAPTNDSADGPDRHQTRASITTAVGTGPRPEDAPPRCLCLEGLPRHYTAGGCSCYQAPSKSHRRSLPLRLTLRYTGRQPLTGAHNGSELCPPSTTRGRPNEISCTLGRPPRPRCQLDTPTRQPTPVLGSAAVFQFGIVACTVVLRLAGG